MDGEDGKLTEKLYKMIMSWTDGIKVRGFQTPSLATFRELVRIYKEIKAGGHPDFIDGESKKVLEKCGFQLEPCGIGWIVDNAKQGDFSGETRPIRFIHSVLYGVEGRLQNHRQGQSCSFAKRTLLCVVFLFSNLAYATFNAK